MLVNLHYLCTHLRESSNGGHQIRLETVVRTHSLVLKITNSNQNNSIGLKTKCNLIRFLAAIKTQIQVKDVTGGSNPLLRTIIFHAEVV